jgi:hypothetical protein
MFTTTSLVRLVPPSCVAALPALTDLTCSLHLRTLLPASIWLSYGWAGLLLPLLLRCRALPFLGTATESQAKSPILESEPPCVPTEYEAR